VTPGVDFFRLDRSGSTKRLFAVGIVMVTAGASAVGAHLMHRLAEATGHVVSLVGGLTMISGLVMTFGAMAMMLFENVYLAIRDDGLLLHQNGKESTIPWDDLTKVIVDAGFVELRRGSGENVVRWFAGKDAKNVAGRIEEAKRKAAHGLLRGGDS
jgi:hypothetical protein